MTACVVLPPFNHLLRPSNHMRAHTHVHFDLYAKSSNKPRTTASTQHGHRTHSGTQHALEVYTHRHTIATFFLIAAVATPPVYYHTARGAAASSLASTQHFLSPMNSHLPFSSPLSITIIAIITTSPPLQRPHQSRLIREDFHMG